MNVASLQKVAHALVESRTVDSVLQVIVQSLSEQSDIAMSRVWLKGPGDICSACPMAESCASKVECLHLLASDGNAIASEADTEEFTRVDGHYGRIPLNSDLMVSRVARTGTAKLLHGDDAEPMGRWLESTDWVNRQHINSFAGQPLIFEGEVLGVLALFSWEKISTDDFRWLRTFADSAALAIAAARSAEQKQKIAHDLDLQIQVLQSIPATAWTVTAEGQLDFVNRFYLDVLGETIESCTAPFDVWNKTGRDLPPFLQRLHPDHKERVRQIFWDGIQSGNGWTFEAPFLHKHDARYHWHIDRAVPLKDGDGKVVRFVGSCADIDELKRAEEKNRTLLEISNLMASSLMEPALLTSIFEALRQVVQFDASGLYLPEKDNLRMVAVAGSDALEICSSPGLELSRDECRGALAFDQLGPVLVEDLEKDTVYEDDRLLADAGMRSRCLVPLISEGKAIGVLGLASKKVGFYSDSDTEFITEVGNQVALAVQNMNAYEQIAALKAKLELENTYFQEEIRKEHNFDEILGNSPELIRLLDKVESAAPTDANVLIFGETGSGKELIARSHPQPQPAEWASACKGKLCRYARRFGRERIVRPCQGSLHWCLAAPGRPV